VHRKHAVRTAKLCFVQADKKKTKGEIKEFREENWKIVKAKDQIRTGMESLPNCASEARSQDR